MLAVAPTTGPGSTVSTPSLDQPGWGVALRAASAHRLGAPALDERRKLPASITSNNFEDEKAYANRKSNNPRGNEPS